MVSKSGLPISGMGGISTWSDAAEFLLLGASSLQVCTAVMHYGFRIIEDLCDGLSRWMDEKGFKTVADVVGRSLHRVSEFQDFDLSYRAVARIDAEKCIRCDLCYVACNDAAHECIDLVSPQGAVVQPLAYDARANGKGEATAARPQPVVRDADCVGCRLCYNVCPVDDCIRDGRTSLRARADYVERAVAETSGGYGGLGGDASLSGPGGDSYSLVCRVGPTSATSAGPPFEMEHKPWWAGTRLSSLVPPYG